MMSRISRASAGLVLLLLLAACSVMRGQVDDGTYVAPDAEFTVAIPPGSGTQCSDGIKGPKMEYLDCVGGNGFWMDFGEYSLEWYALDHSYTDDQFYNTSEPNLVRYAQGFAAAPFSVISSQRLTLNGHAAYRVVTRGTKNGADVYCVATSVNFGTRAAIAYMLVAAGGPGVHERGPLDAEHAAAWGFYPNFIASIRSKVIVH